MLQFYSIDDVCKSTSFSRGGIYKQIKNGLFPRSIKWGKSARWPAGEVEAVFNARLANRTDSEIREIVKVLHEARTETTAATIATAKEGGAV